MISIPRFFLVLSFICFGAHLCAADGYQAFGDASTVYSTGVKALPGLPIYFSSGSTAGQNAAPTMKAQALATLGKLKENITTAGFSLQDVVFVRAYLVPGPDGKVDYAGWNEAWGEYFNNPQNSHKPARTTVAVPLLGRPEVLIEVEFVCTATAIPNLFSSSDKLGLPMANPALKPYGTKEARIYTGMGVKPGTTFYWTSGSQGPVLKPDAPATSLEKYGDMKTQARGVLKHLQQDLIAVGLSFSDVVYLRAFVGPDKLRDGKYNLDGWNQAYDEFFNTPANPHKPARTTVTTPGFGTSGSMLEVEIIAAFPGKPGEAVTFSSSAANPNLKDFGVSSAAISAGVAVANNAAFYWSAGVGPKVNGDLKTQTISAFETLKERMAQAGLSFKDVVFLRLYIVPEKDGTVDRKARDEAYDMFFNNPKNPHKPARTTIAVVSLPRPDWKIEIDAIAVAP